MLKIRLKRYGRKKHAVYRIIVIDSRKKRDGRALEEVGFYNPFTKEARLNVDQVKQHISNGAQFSNTAKSLFQRINQIQINDLN